MSKGKNFIKIILYLTILFIIGYCIFTAKMKFTLLITLL